MKTVKLLAEMEYDLDFRLPRVTATEKYITMESVEEIMMISQTSVTARNAKGYVTVTGDNFVIREIGEGRLVIEGRIQNIEFL